MVPNITATRIPPMAATVPTAISVPSIRDGRIPVTYRTITIANIHPSIVAAISETFLEDFFIVFRSLFASLIKELFVNLSPFM